VCCHVFDSRAFPSSFFLRTDGSASRIVSSPSRILRFIEDGGLSSVLSLERRGFRLPSESLDSQKRMVFNLPWEAEILSERVKSLGGVAALCHLCPVVKR